MFIEQEKDLVERKIFAMISTYDAVNIKSTSITKQLEDTKTKISSILDSDKLIKPKAF